MGSARPSQIDPRRPAGNMTMDSHSNSPDKYRGNLASGKKSGNITPSDSRKQLNF